MKTVLRDLPCCVDCRHARVHRGPLLIGHSRWLGIPRFRSGAGEIEGITCTRFSIAGRDPITGAERPDDEELDADACRSSPEFCGIRATHFEPRDPR